MWNCQCDCGNSCIAPVGKLSIGSTKSCGCLKDGSFNITHGMSKDNKVYSTWLKIKDRCLNKNCKSYKDYGGAGVIIQESFINDFTEFFNEVGFPPDNEQKWSIDRIDNTLGYVSGNMRWATYFQQARNKTKSALNTSGFTGVTWLVKSGNLQAKASWNEEVSGRIIRVEKTFSVNKYGLLPAFALACKHREDKINELNSLGYGYSENHGK